jgi:hypothetical protein
MPSPEFLTQMTKQNSGKPEKPVLSQEELRTKLEQKLKSTKPLLEEGMKEYKEALESGLFDNQDGEEEGEGEKRKENMQKRLTALFDRAEKMKAKLDSGEPLEEDTEPPTELNSFLLSTYKGWGVEQTKLDSIQFSPESVSPLSLNYTAKKADTDATKYGEYTLNPDTASIDYDSIPEDKIKVITLPDNLNGKPLDEIANYILQTYPNAKLPGLDLYKYISENPNSTIAQKLKDGKYHFFFGSLFRRSDGDWHVPYVRWSGSSFSRNGNWLTRSWHSACRVVLLEI